jgi:hypothetical protein
MPTLAQASTSALACLQECARRLAQTGGQLNKDLARDATKVAHDFEEALRSDRATPEDHPARAA